jgi:hypothetical protein
MTYRRKKEKKGDVCVKKQFLEIYEGFVIQCYQVDFIILK